MTARASRPGTPRDKRRVAAHGASVLAICALSLASAAASAQGSEPAQAQAGSRPNWLITPSFSVEGTYTDNVNLTAEKKSDFVTRLSPGVTLDGRSSRASASLNYQWQYYKYAQNSALDNPQRSLAAKGKLELVDQWLFVEASHNIAQSTVSAFGTQSAGNELSNGNRTETRAYSISPYIQGHLGSVADYQLRFSGTSARSDSGALSGTATTTSAWTGRLAGATPFVPLSWAINSDQQIVGQTTGSDTRSSSLAGTLTYQIDPQIRLSGSAGRESDNFSGALQQKRNTSGVGVDWAPTERTQVSLKKDRNAAGNAHSVDFNHRTALTAWKFSDSRSIVTPTPQLALVNSPYYDRLYQLLASIEPDAAKRAGLTRALLGPLAFNSVMTSQVYTQRQQQASVALMGVNNTVTIGINRSTSENMRSGIGLADDFAANSTIRQSGINASWSHKLTPDTSLSLTGSASRSTGNNIETSLKSWSLLLSTPLGASTSATLGLRQSHSDGATGYDEHALTGSMSLKF